MATRKELTTAVSERYRASTRAEKARILDEFVVITGFHRKHAMRLLRRREGPVAGWRARPRIYGEAERNALILLWEASDRICGKRLEARYCPSFSRRMERHGHFDLAPEIRGKLLAMSAATMTGAGTDPRTHGTSPTTARGACPATEHSR